MFEALLKVLSTIAATIKDAPALVTAIGNRMDNKQREQAIRDLRILHFSPAFRSALARAADANYAADPKTLDALRQLLDETAKPVAEAVDRLLEFGDTFTDLPYQDFSTLMAFLDGKTSIRKQITDLLAQLQGEPATGLETISLDELEAVQNQIVEINRAIGQTHEAIRLLARFN